MRIQNISILMLLLLTSLSIANGGCNGASANFSCGSVVTQSCTLNESITDTTAGNCFNLTSVNSLTLNCNGFTITGNNATTNPTSAIYLSKNSSTIQNCVIIGNFSTQGIYISGANNLIQNTNVTDTSSGTVYAILITSATAINNTILNSIGNGTSTTGYGITITTSASGNTIKNSIGAAASTTVSHGGIHFAAANNIISNSTGITYGAGSAGMFITGSNTTILNSLGTVYPATLGSFGIEFINAPNSVMNDSTGYGNIGIATYTTASNGLVMNRVNGSASTAGGYGIDLQIGSAKVYDSIAAGQTNGYGFVVLGGGSNVMNNITATTAVGGHAFSLQGSGYNNVTNSTAISAGIGIGFSFGSQNNIVSNITAKGTASGWGTILFWTASAANNTLSNSMINGTGGAVGVYLGSSAPHNNTLFNNTITNSKTLLFIDTTSYGNTFYGNNFTTTSAAPNLFVNDTDANATTPNYYNTTEGNFWQNVINGSILVTGTTSSSYFTNYYVGNGGVGVPYNQTTSGNKFWCNWTGCADKAPLTNVSAVPINISLSVYPDPIIISNQANFTANCVGATNATLTVNKSGTVNDYTMTNSGSGIFTFSIAPGGLNNTPVGYNVTCINSASNVTNSTGVQATTIVLPNIIINTTAPSGMSAGSIGGIFFLLTSPGGYNFDATHVNLSINNFTFISHQNLTVIDGITSFSTNLSGYWVFIAPNTTGTYNYTVSVSDTWGNVLYSDVETIMVDSSGFDSALIFFFVLPEFIFVYLFLNSKTYIWSRVWMFFFCMMLLSNIFISFTIATDEGSTITNVVLAIFVVGCVMAIIGFALLMIEMLNQVIKFLKDIAGGVKR